MYTVNEIKLNILDDESKILDNVSKELKIDKINISNIKIIKKSIDAREKKIRFSYNVCFDINNVVDNKIQKLLDKNILHFFNEKHFNPIFIKENKSNKQNEKRPLIVGFGPAGIFCAYILALNGLKPIIFERGKCIEERDVDTKKFLDSKNNVFENLDVDSNISFGEGGAGTYSDGKLYTNNKDKDGLNKFVLETFVKFGADEKILYEAHPHIGTDVIKKVIVNMRKEIISLGGEIHFSKKFEIGGDLELKHLQKEYLAIVLSIGNAARDTFKNLVENNFDIKKKNIAMGLRICIPQNNINNSQYDNVNESELRELGPAIYKTVYTTKDNNSIYSFCMCPGGYVINSSSEKNKLCINGMSYSDRDGKYANSAIVKNFNDNENENPLANMFMQEKIEESAYKLCNGKIPYCSFLDILSKEKNLLKQSSLDYSNIEKNIFEGAAEYCKNLINIYDENGLLFKDDFLEAMKYFKHILKFDENDVIVAAAETRTSSPVKLDRNENFMCNVDGFYPCGEGLGHGGGIISCAIDGINVAIKILTK